MWYLLTAGAAGIAAGCTARLRYGDRSNPTITERGLIATIGGTTATWWACTYPLATPGAGQAVVGSLVGYVLGQLVGSVVAAFRRRPPGHDDGGNGGGGGSGWEPPIGPIGPDPEDHLPEAAPIVLTFGDFLAQTRTPAPAEPSRPMSPV